MAKRLSARWAEQKKVVQHVVNTILTTDLPDAKVTITRAANQDIGDPDSGPHASGWRVSPDTAVPDGDKAIFERNLVTLRKYNFVCIAICKQRETAKSAPKGLPSAEYVDRIFTMLDNAKFFEAIENFTDSQPVAYSRKLSEAVDSYLPQLLSEALDAAMPFYISAIDVYAAHLTEYSPEVMCDMLVAGAFAGNIVEFVESAGKRRIGSNDFYPPVNFLRRLHRIHRAKQMCNCKDCKN